MANYNIKFVDFNNCTVNWGANDLTVTPKANDMSSEEFVNDMSNEVTCECGYRSLKNELTDHLKSNLHNIIMKHKDRLVNNKLQCVKCKTNFDPTYYEKHLKTKCTPYDINNTLAELGKGYIYCTCNVWVLNKSYDSHLKSPLHNMVNVQEMVFCICNSPVKIRNFLSHIKTKTHSAYLAKYKKYQDRIFTSY